MPTRRAFIRNLALATAGAALLPARSLRANGSSGASRAATGLRALDSATTAAERVRIIENFVHHRCYDPTGLMYAETDWAEERPFVPSDFSCRDSTVSGPEPSQWLNYEDSPYHSGFFLAAQCYRYRATRDPEALEFARRAFASIDADYRLTGRGSPGGLFQKAGIIEIAGQPRSPGKGWFCKPWGGIATGQTSTEQNFGPVYGMYLYWPIAPVEVRSRISQILGEVSEHWRREYKVNFFGESWDFETSYPRAPRHMLSWAAIHRMAYEVTKDPASYDEYSRLDALFGAMPTPLETVWGLGEPAYISTEDRSFHLQVVIAGEILAGLEPEKAARYRQGMAKWWRFSQIGQREDLASYYFIKVDSATGHWEKLPVSVKPRPLWSTSFMFQNGTWPICMRTTQARQTITSAMVARLVPEEAAAARERWRRIFSRLRKEELRSFIDPESVVPPELTWMTRTLSGDSLVIYPLGYWYAKAHGLGLG